MAEEARRGGRGRRADRQSRDRQGQRRGAVAGRRRADRATGQGRRHGRRRRGDRAHRRGRVAPPAAAPAQAAAAATTNPAGAGETPALRGDADAPERRSADRRATKRRSRPVAGGAPRGARISCRSDAHPGHRQGRPPDQGRRDRRRRGAEAVPRRRPGPRRRRRKHRRSRSEGSASWTPACAGDWRTPRRARQDVAPPPDDRQAPEGSAEHRRDADDVQRRRHDAR